MVLDLACNRSRAPVQLNSTCSEQFPLVLRIEVIHNFPVRGDTHISRVHTRADRRIRASARSARVNPRQVQVHEFNKNVTVR